MTTAACLHDIKGSFLTCLIELTSCPQKFVWKNSDVRCYGMVTQMLDDMVLVDNTFCLGFSQVLSGLEEDSV
jgi:hypothetical protein